MSVQKQTGITPIELKNLSDLPRSCFDCWNWFLALNNTRLEGFNGVLPITYAEMLSYFTLFKLEPFDWEIVLIKRLDVVLLNHQRRQSSKSEK